MDVTAKIIRLVRFVIVRELMMNEIITEKQAVLALKLSLSNRFIPDIDNDDSNLLFIDDPYTVWNIIIGE